MTPRVMLDNLGCGGRGQLYATRTEGCAAMAIADSDNEHELAAATSEQWRVYEEEVESLLSSLDPGATVERDVRVRGDLSGTPRQVDVLVTGNIAAQPLTVAVECKHYARALGIGAIDEFAGKLLDLGVERGVLFALNGLTEPAHKRAEGSKVPRIAVSDLLVGPLHIELDTEFLLRGFGGCPNENCYTGDIGWRWWLSNDDRLRAGQCTTCGTWAVECPECGEIQDFVWDEVPCCEGITFSLVYDRKHTDVEEIEVQSVKETSVYHMADWAEPPHADILEE